MSDRFAGDSFEAYLREEAAQAERFTARARIVLALAIPATLLLAPFSEVYRATIPLTMALALVYGTFAVTVYALARRAYHPRSAT